MQHLETCPQIKCETIQKEKELFIRYGSAASEAMFDFPCHFFQTPECSGSIPYRLEHHCAVVFGEPLCPPDEVHKLVEAFHKYCDKSNLNVIYIIVSEPFARWVMKNGCHMLIESSRELIFDPAFDPCKTSNRLRHRVEKAVKHGLTVHEYVPYDPEIEEALKKIGVKWQEAIKGPHIYLGHLDFFESYAGKRWFYAKDGGEITSMIMLSRLDGRDGWLLKFLTTLPHAFHDTSEFLMTSVLDILRKEGCRYLSKGTIPADTLRDIEGMGAFAQWNVRFVYKIISSIYKFKKRKEYWLRYSPKIEPTYLIFKRPHIGLNEIRALLKVFRTSYSFMNHHR
jgi:lysylphosphatidylglycerol synthetase-like protein (DUF2156 family)